MRNRIVPLLALLIASYGQASNRIGKRIPAVYHGRIELKFLWFYNTND
jgi:hypothetical protein